jgi:hypothetical protein
MTFRTQTAGILAGTWYAHPGRHIGHALIAAGLLILAGVTDHDQLEDAMRLGNERGSDALRGMTQPTPPAEHSRGRWGLPRPVGVAVRERPTGDGCAVRLLRR